MSIQPYTSPNDPSPITAGSTSPGGTPGATIPVGSAVPDLLMDYTTAPDFAPDQQQQPGTGTPPPALPPVDDLSIDLGSLRDAENAMLTASANIVTSYTSLKTSFEGDKDTIFGQAAAMTILAPESLSNPVTGTLTKTANDTQPGPNGQPARAMMTVPDPIQGTAKAFANGQDGTPGMNDIEAFALQTVGNAMGLLGVFMAMMNAAGYAYTQADASSFLPQAQIPPGS